MIIKGNVKWAFIQTPNTKYEPKYTVNLFPENPEDLSDFEAQGYPVKVDETTQEKFIVVKRKVMNKNGKKLPVPKLLDAQKNPIDIQVGNGSYVAVQLRPWDIGDFKGFELQGVQVLDLVEYSGDGDEFEAFDIESEF